MPVAIATPSATRTRNTTVRLPDRVVGVIAAIESGRLKGRKFEKAIENFSLEELEKLSSELLKYYFYKFR